jgi:hypothetical protein
MFDKWEIDVQLDITAGCQRSCGDCVVSFNSPMFISRAKDFNGLMSQCSEEFFLGNLILGPTDVFASNQSVDYSDPAVLEIASHFKTVTLSTSLLGKKIDIINHAERIGKLFTQQIKLSIPVDLREVDNKKYRDHIWEKINLFEEHLGRPLGTSSRKVYFIGNLPTKQDDIDPNIFDKFVKDWGVQLDIAINNGRKGIKDLKPVFDNAVEFFTNRIDKVNNFPGALMEEGRGIDLLFRNGELYYMPFYNERIGVLDNKFKLFKNQDWTLDNLIKDINSLMVESMEAGQVHPECATCDLNSRCSLFLIPVLLNSLDIETCVQPKEVMKKHGSYNQAH